MLLGSALRAHVRAIGPLVAGREAHLEVKLVALRPVRVRGLHATVIARQGWRAGLASERIANHIIGPVLPLPIVAAGVVARGTTRVALRFVLPAMPPSHAIGPAYGELAVRVHEQMPWWRWDRGDEVVLPVAAVPHAAARTPGKLVAKLDHRQAVRIELAVASTTVVPGDRLPGACAVLGVDDRAACAFELQLVAVVALKSRDGDDERELACARTTVAVPPGSAGAALPFALDVPATATPGFRGSTHDLRWEVVAVLRRGRFGDDLRVRAPIEVVVAAPPLPRLTAAAVPHVGGAGLADVLAAFAAGHPGWRVADDATMPAIERATADARIRIGYASRGTAGIVLHAAIAYPRLGLGLDVARRGGARGGLRNTVAGWFEDHQVTVRFERQASPVIHAVANVMVALGDPYRLVAWSDAQLAVERRSRAVRATDVAAFADAAAHLAEAIATARTRIAPPPVVAADVDAWRALAASLGGVLTVGDLSIAGGAVDGSAVEIGLDLARERAGEAVVVAVGSPELARDGDDDRERAAVAGALATWPDDIVQFMLVGGVARAHIRLVRRTAALPVADPARARDLAHRLRGVLALLEPASGPYR